MTLLRLTSFELCQVLRGLELGPRPTIQHDQIRRGLDHADVLARADPRPAPPICQNRQLGGRGAFVTRFADALHKLHHVQSANSCAKPPSYEAAASSRDAPMMLRSLSNSRDSSLETCIWLMPSSRAMSDCERCSK